MGDLEGKRRLARAAIAVIANGSEAVKLGDWVAVLDDYGSGGGRIYEGLNAGLNLSGPPDDPDTARNALSNFGLEPPLSGLMSDYCKALWRPLKYRERRRRMGF